MGPEDKSIDHPHHYTAGSIEVYDFIKSWNLDFATGNIIKYVARSPYKYSKLNDLKKARWYLNKLIEHEEALIAERVANKMNADQEEPLEVYQVPLQAYKDG